MKFFLKDLRGKSLEELAIKYNTIPLSDDTIEISGMFKREHIFENPRAAIALTSLPAHVTKIKFSGSYSEVTQSRLEADGYERQGAGGLFPKYKKIYHSVPEIGGLIPCFIGYLPSSVNTIAINLQTHVWSDVVESDLYSLLKSLPSHIIYFGFNQDKPLYFHHAYLPDITFKNKILWGSNIQMERIPSPATLCHLAKIGDLKAIKEGQYDVHQINALIRGALFGCAPIALGVYNALMIAAAYRHFDVVKYFIEEAQANIELKGGYWNNWTVLDCAVNKWWDVAEPNVEMITYLRDKLSAHREIKDRTPPDAFFQPVQNTVLISVPDQASTFQPRKA